MSEQLSIHPTIHPPTRRRCAAVRRSMRERPRAKKKWRRSGICFWWVLDRVWDWEGGGREEGPQLESCPNEPQAEILHCFFVAAGAMCFDAMRCLPAVAHPIHPLHPVGLAVHLARPSTRHGLFAKGYRTCRSPSPPRLLACLLAVASVFRTLDLGRY
ncbi:hypothetical protein LX36DRAFT_233912 [Colletotrichum falcatum]|nr:hypothetical protein LX36DRAFT_233912 [Colletotrichum falcatum]